MVPCKIYFLSLLVFYASVHSSISEEYCRSVLRPLLLEPHTNDAWCRKIAPSFVRGISVSDEHLLEWSAPPANDCEISYYMITILSRGEESVYEVNDTSLDVSFLPTCEDAQFTVIPISTENVQGATVTLHLQMPVHKDANVTIDNVRLTQQDGGHVLLEWEVEEEFKHCTNRFRVLIYNEEYNDAVDIYVQATSTLLQHIRPCEHYQFGVRAIFSLIREGPIFLMSYSTPSARTAAPAVQSISLDTTSVDLKWQLETYFHNKCEVSAITVTSSPYFTVTYPVRDSMDRPLVDTKITGLSPDTLYLLNVTVINVAGPSIPALVVIQTLPES